jgi:hypothetical protein
LIAQEPMSASHTRKEGKRYRHYVCQAAQKGEAAHDQIRALLKAPEVVMATWRAAKGMSAALEKKVTVRQALDRLDPLWEELFPAEQARIVQLLMARSRCWRRSWSRPWWTGGSDPQSLWTT